MKSIFMMASCLLLSVSMIGCSDDETPSKGSITLEFDNVVGEADLELNTTDEPYTNAAGESYKVTTLKYYVSSIKLHRADGTIFEDEVSATGDKGYYLIDESDAESREVTLSNVPAGDYDQITFTIGVDASKVDEGAQAGALDPVNGMFWSWNSGYIFLKLEGTSSSSSDENNLIMYHVGGYTEPNNIRTKTISTGDHVATVRGNLTPEVHLIIDVNKFFDAPNQISFENAPVRHMPADNVVVAENYVNTFIVDHVHN
jgi:hypothetical protein